MKPILFNTEMTKAILDGRKTVTRRNPFQFVMKDGYNPNYSGYSLGEYFTGHIKTGVCLYSRGAHDVWGVRSNVVKPKYQVGDVPYVRETWCDRWLPDGFLEGKNRYGYKADGEPTFGYWGNEKQCKDNVWIPSIHMPKEAARIFLKVTGVRVERLQEMAQEDAIKEGVESPSEEQFAELWNSTIKKQDLDTYSWDANPWVWVIEFERIEKGE
ncbi:hypothetical protein [Anaerotignum sp.]|uniref:hypothetical protein n=1 Tax=Anaerotignum sp. TaxID=2039241 RepID=UPI002714A4C7|nr:hypothetical protein [Anaerotignum sp.]